MPALPELQQGLIARLINRGGAEGLPVAEGGAFTPGQRFNVYTNNTQMILRDLLKAVFPVTTLLLGEKFMAFAAQEFIAAYPPDSGDMNGYGADFPAYLSRLPNLNQFAYVPDIAQLEWLAHEAYLSPRLPPLTAELLAAAEDPMALELKLQPHIHILRSAWPVDRLWEEVSAKGAALHDFRMQAAETFIAIYREEDRIALWSITEGGYKFLEHLQSSPSLALAAEAALRAESGLQLDLLLATLLQHKLLAA
jgi:hypothetical protein